MRTFKIIDASLQTIFLLAALVGVFTPFLILYAMFFIGLLQLTTALVTTILWRKEANRTAVNIRTYWIMVIVYFAGLAVLYAAHSAGFIDEIITGIWFFSAWIIAIYYYLLTLRMAFAKEKTDSQILMRQS
ncbi:MAG: hypothetical protein FD123_298 [Bacteroidetes bacterium]|nr:MAG: hypothetical protein FD123_298 [Bacteroidota bacterium]